MQTAEGLVMWFSEVQRKARRWSLSVQESKIEGLPPNLRNLSPGDCNCLDAKIDSRAGSQRPNVGCADARRRIGRVEPLE